MSGRHKKTPIGEIPEDWEVVRLGDIGKVVNGFAFPIRYQGQKNMKYLFVKVSDTNLPGNEKYIFTTENTIDEKTAKILKAKIYPPETIIFPKIGMTLYLRKVRILAKPGTFDNNIMGIVPNETLVDGEFLYYYILGKIDFTKLVGRTTTPSIRKSEVEKLKIPLSPLPEQKKIAEILRTVDEAIEKTDLAIERTGRLKRGLMGELLTKGIGHKEFKKTEIGRIPKEWRVAKLEELLIAIQDTPHKVPKKTTKGIPFVSVNYVLQFPDYNFYIDHSKAGIEYISEDNVEFIKKFIPERGDIVYTKWGTPGVAKLVNTDDKFIGLCSLALLKPNRSLVYPLFLVYALNSNATRKQIIPHSKTSTRTEIHKKHIRNILLPLPPLSEQQKIAEILSTVDRRLELLRKRREKLERVKRGLMKDLLTGRRRVKVG